MKIELVAFRGIHGETVNEGIEDSDTTGVETHGCDGGGGGGGGVKRRTGGTIGDGRGFMTFSPGPSPGLSL